MSVRSALRARSQFSALRSCADRSILDGMSSGEATRSKRIKRVFLLVADLLAGREHDAQSLALRLGIKPAQATRLLNTALDSLPGVVKTRKRPLKIRIDSGVVPAPSYPTAVAACFGSSLWPLFDGTTYAKGIRDASKEVIGRTKRRDVFRDIERKFWFLRRGGEVALVDRSAFLDDVIDGVLHHKLLALEYTRFDGSLEAVRVEPLSVVLHDHQLYVVGRDRERKLHPYRFARIRSVTVLDDTFEYPTRSEYDPKRAFSQSFGVFLNTPAENVVLKLHLKWATYAQTHHWHHSQDVVPARDHIVVRMHVGVCHELVAWILGFGEEAEVLEPASLRATLVERAQALGRIYSTQPGVRKARDETGIAPAKIKKS